VEKIVSLAFAKSTASNYSWAIRTIEGEMAHVGIDWLDMSRARLAEILVNVAFGPARIKASSINICRTAGNLMLDLHDQNSGTLMRLASTAINRNDPGKAKYETTWDPSIVYRLLEKWGPPESLELDRLRARAVVLLRLARMLRSDDIIKIDMTLSTISADAFVFHTRRAKHDRDISGVSRPRVIKAMSQDYRAICAVANVYEYHQRTREWRARMGHQGRLFFAHDGEALSAQRIGKISMEVMQKAGVNTDIYKAHTIRHAAISKALLSHHSIDEVMAAAQISNAHVILKYYAKSVEGRAWGDDDIGQSLALASPVKKHISPKVPRTTVHVVESGKSSLLSPPG
jgi:hypothetical protein